MKLHMGENSCVTNKMFILKFILSYYLVTISYYPLNFCTDILASAKEIPQK